MKNPDAELEKIMRLDPKAFTNDSQTLVRAAAVLGLARTGSAGVASVAYAETIIGSAFIMICKSTGLPDEEIIESLRYGLKSIGIKAEPEADEGGMTGLPPMGKGGDA